MQGLEEARALYEDFGRPMLREQFPQLEGTTILPGASACG